MKTWYMILCGGIVLLMASQGWSGTEGRARPRFAEDRTPLRVDVVPDEEVEAPEKEERTPEERLKELERRVRWLIEAVDPDDRRDELRLERRLRDLERKLDDIEQELRRLEDRIHQLEIRR